MIGLSYGNLASSGVGFDPDSQAFITAASITGETQQNAVNTLVIDLKGQGSTTNNTNVWADLLGIFPYCPNEDIITNVNDLIESYKTNLKTANKELTFYNFVSSDFTYNGVQASLSSAGAGTGYTPPSTQNFGFTSVRTTGGTTNSRYQLGCANSLSQYLLSLTNSYWSHGTFSTVTTTGVTDLKNGVTSQKNTSNLIKVFTQGILRGNRTISNNSVGGELYLHNKNDLSSIGSRQNFNFFAYHNFLSDNQVKDLFDSYTKYNINLGR